MNSPVSSGKILTTYLDKYVEKARDLNLNTYLDLHFPGDKVDLERES